MLPTSLAPNLITLIGITGLIVAFLVTATMLPELEGKGLSMAQTLPASLTCRCITLSNVKTLGWLASDILYSGNRLTSPHLT